MNTRYFTNFVAKGRTSLYFLEQIFATCNNPNCCKTGVIYTPVPSTQTGRHKSERSGGGGGGGRGVVGEGTRKSKERESL